METEWGDDMETTDTTLAAQQFRQRRYLARVCAMQFLYGMDLQKEWTMEQEPFQAYKQMLDEGLLEEMACTLSLKECEKAWEYSRCLVKNACREKDYINGLIMEAAANWSLERIAPVDRAIMRMAISEMAYVTEVSAAISINEAVDIAKQFGQPDSARFINGVLEKIRRLIAERGVPPRTPLYSPAADELATDHELNPKENHAIATEGETDDDIATEDETAAISFEDQGEPERP